MIRVARTQDTDQEPRARRAPGTIGRFIAALGRLTRLLLLSLLVSIVVEWLGMHWWWPEQGVDHSHNMLQAEIAYLNANAPRSLLSTDPADFVRQFSETAYQALFVRSGVLRFIDWLSELPPNASAPRQKLHHIFGTIESYVIAAINIVQVFCARIAVLCLAGPLFVLIAIVGVVDGLVQRDLRRWGGGRESSYLYHYAKRSNGVFLLSAGVLYLALPLSIPPVLILLPFAVLLGISLSITASMFKKYL